MLVGNLVGPRVLGWVLGVLLILEFLFGAAWVAVSLPAAGMSRSAGWAAPVGWFPALAVLVVVAAFGYGVYVSWAVGRGRRDGRKRSGLAVVAGVHLAGAVLALLTGPWAAGGVSVTGHGLAAVALPVTAGVALLCRSGLAGEPAAPPGGRRRRALISGGVLAVLSVVALCRAFGIEGFTPAAQMVSFIPVTGLITLLIASVLIARARLWLSLWGVVLLVAHGVWIVPSFVRAAEATSESNMRIAAVNAKLGAASADEIMGIAWDADVLVVVELTPRLMRRLDDAGLASEMPYGSRNPLPGASGAAVFSRKPVEILPSLDTQFPMPRIRVRPDGAGPMTITAVHSFPPIPGGVGSWRADLDVLTSTLAGDGGKAVAIGDFNATRDHRAFRELLRRSGTRDSADHTGTGWFPTWPEGGGVPGVVQLDHAVVGADIIPVGVRSRRVSGTDHRAIILEAHVRPAESG